MTTTFETRDGIDVAIDINPNTPIAWRRAAPLLGHIDHLASVAANLDAEWTIQVTVAGIPTITLTAEPATEQGAAA